MEIKQVNDKYWLIWPAHITEAAIAKKWCWDTFGSGWGEIKTGVPDNRGKSVHVVIFCRLSHANWFALKFTDFDK